MVLAGNQRCLVLIKPETSVDEFASRVARYLLCPLLALQQRKAKINGNPGSLVCVYSDSIVRLCIQLSLLSTLNLKLSVVCHDVFSNTLRKRPWMINSYLDKLKAALLNTSSSETKVDSTRTELNARGIEESTMSPYIVAIVLLTAMVLAAAEEEHCCPKNQTWSQCGPVCESTCKDPRVKMCKLRPCTDSTAGCTCENGYVRDEDSFTCLKYEDCVTA
ncbi:uncharacterized protein LOC128891339 isoform X1 [Hylaeus anthracinus]|uniref:uncharacterized protein LOC128891339 isoform X1 n=1 Tax=Hylaeus anthracinus TaxID=313031 RepID=UPI0023B9E303|nr:uncharacterized protein LOC128891339 isoform X1 [Hylaeus anthracinus]